MDDFYYNADPIIVIPVGTKLYKGGKLEDISTCFKPFFYVGKHGHMNDGHKMYEAEVIVQGPMIVMF